MPVGAISRKIPRLALPIRLDGTTLATVEQDSEDDVLQCAFAVVAYERGSRWEDPEFGIEDPTFGTEPIDTTDWITAINRYEPRAAVSTAEDVSEIASKIRVLTAAKS